MKTRKAVKRILFYGDSLVFGKVPGKNKRFLPHERFTGQIQELLGDQYDVLEEGLRARTLTGENPFFPERNGLEQFGPIIGSHLPIDMLVILLGTNDCNQRPDFEPSKTALALQEYAAQLQEWAAFLAVEQPRVVIMLPPDINSAAYDEPANRIFGNTAPGRVAMLRQELSVVAQEFQWDTIDLSHYCSPDVGDGVHLSVPSNAVVAETFATFLKNKL